MLPILQRMAPCVRNMSVLPFFLIAVIEVEDFEPTQRGIGKNIAMAALSHPWIKIAVVVNKDVNIYDTEDVLWAIATRVDFDRDIVRVPDTFGFPLDEMKESRDAPITRMGIDATVDPRHRRRFERARPRGFEEIKLGDYLG